MALHYKTPYPKPYNMSKLATPERIAENPEHYLRSSHMVPAFKFQSYL